MFENQLETVGGLAGWLCHTKGNTFSTQSSLQGASRLLKVLPVTVELMNCAPLVDEKLAEVASDEMACDTFGPKLAEKGSAINWTVLLRKRRFRRCVPSRPLLRRVAVVI